MHRLPVTLALAIVSLAGCATYPPPDEPIQRRAAQPPAERKETPGVVESVREVQVDSRSTGVGPIAGAAVGGTLGSGVGRGRGSAAGAVVGTVIGGILGEAAALEATQPGFEITVRLDEWKTVVVRQPKTSEIFQPGDRVRVVGEGLNARVTK